MSRILIFWPVGIGTIKFHLILGFKKIKLDSLLRSARTKFNLIWGSLTTAHLINLSSQPGLGPLEKLFKTPKWSEIWLSGTSKWSDIWLIVKAKWSNIWLSGTPKQSEISILKKCKYNFLRFFKSSNKYFLLHFPSNPNANWN